MENAEFLKCLLPNISFEWSNRTGQVVAKEHSLQVRNMSLSELSGKIYQKFNKSFTVEEIEEAWNDKISEAKKDGLK
jgi:hypothetical protein